MKNKNEKREELRNKGQFWTPDWAAQAMVAYVAQTGDLVFDPGVGKGVFYTALKKLGRTNKFYGTDIDSEIISEAKAEGVFDTSCELEVRDFILNPPNKLFRAIVANPPYIRHHRFSQELKNKLRLMSLQIIRDKLDGRAGLHIYFLIQALNLLDDGGRLAFIMPADTCEGVFAKKLWNWITRKFCLEGIVVFDHKASPFPGVDTNAVIFLIRNTKPTGKIKWAKCLKAQTLELTRFLDNNLQDGEFSDLVVYDRSLNEALVTGLSRPPRKNGKAEFTLGNFARVMRGIATGANEFFFLTKEKAKELGIPNTFLLTAIGRTRDVEGLYIDNGTIMELDKRGRPTLLFFPNGVAWENMPKAVRNYISEGEKEGLSKRILISTRKPWYKMEVRETPSFLFAYLGRKNARFIKNEASVVPLTSFLCVYPHSTDKRYVEKLWQVLQHPDTISNLQLVGKSYGGGAIKVEPRALENLPISKDLVERVDLELPNKVGAVLSLFPEFMQVNHI